VGAAAATRYGGKRVLAFAVSFWSVATLLTPFVADSYPSLIFTRVLLGLGEGLGEFRLSSLPWFIVRDLTKFQNEL
jgi:MFS family permease